MTTINFREEPPERVIVRVHLHTIRIYGAPKGQPRPRAFVRRSTGRAGVYDPGTAEGWKGDIARGCETLEGRSMLYPISVTLTFFMPLPKMHYRANGTLKAKSPVYCHTNKPDADNLAKAVLDALTGIRAWHDDALVSELVVRKYWELPHTHPPGCIIRISKMSETQP